MERNSNVTELIASLEGVIKSHFKNVYAHGGVKRAFGNPILYLQFQLAENEKELSSGIFGNDALNYCYTVELNEDYTLPEKIVLELCHNHGVLRAIDPEIESEKYLRYGRVKIPFRVIKGDSEKIIDSFDKHIKKMVAIMLENKELINQGAIKKFFKVEDKIIG